LDVNLSGAKITGQIDMRSEGENKASFKDVNLSGAKVTGQLAMIGASFDGTLNANALQVGESLFVRHAHCAQAIDMTFVHVSGNLDLGGSTLAGLDLSGSSVAGDLRLGGPPPHWKAKNGEPGDLNLHNTHVGNLTDAGLVLAFGSHEQMTTHLQGAGIQITESRADHG
jgi:uncharacterized protein YjbI with pentapeptide repeats